MRTNGRTGFRNLQNRTCRLVGRRCGLETAVMPSSERCYALPNGHFFRSLFLQS